MAGYEIAACVAGARHDDDEPWRAPNERKQWIEQSDDHDALLHGIEGALYALKELLSEPERLRMPYQGKARGKKSHPGHEKSSTWKPLYASHLFGAYRMEAYAGSV